MHIPSLPAHVFTSAASQALNGAASRASSTVKSFASDLDSGDIAGAQSFLSALQQKLSLSGAGSAVSAQLAQVGSDLGAGNVTAAKTDFTQLQDSIAQWKQTQLPPGSGAGSGGLLAAGNDILQSAYAAAANLALPASLPSLSLSL